MGAATWSNYSKVKFLGKLFDLGSSYKLLLTWWVFKILLVKLWFAFRCILKTCFASILIWEYAWDFVGSGVDSSELKSNTCNVPPSSTYCIIPSCLLHQAPSWIVVNCMHIMILLILYDYLNLIVGKLTNSQFCQFCFFIYWCFFSIEALFG